MKKSFYAINKKEKQEMLNNFYDMVSKIKNKNDAKDFFRDLLTPSEITMIIYRIEIAKMLIQGFHYEDIQKKLKVG